MIGHEITMEIAIHDYPSSFSYIAYYIVLILI